MQNVGNDNQGAFQPQDSQPAPPLGPPKYDIKLWLNQAWNLFKAQPFGLAAVVFIGGVAGCLISLPLFIFFSIGSHPEKLYSMTFI